MTHGVPDLALNNLIGEFPLQEANFLCKRQIFFPKGKFPFQKANVGKHRLVNTVGKLLEQLDLISCIHFDDDQSIAQTSKGLLETLIPWVF